jgi:N-acetylmuramoyl-L-alanine amidase
VRLVIDLKRAIKPQVFTLAPVASYKYRLVFDLMPENPVDPLQALIAQRLEANPGEPAPQDPAMQPSPAVGDGGGNALANQPEEPQDNSHLVQTPTPQLQVPGSSADDSELMAGMAPNSRRSSVFDRFKPSRWGSRGQQPRYERNERYERYERYGQQPQQRYSYPSIRTPRRDSQRLIVIALDPGHGGEDPGAIGPGGTREKDVVLRIAQRLRNRLNSMRVGDTQVRAFLTRDSDFFVPLDMRVAKARRVGARLFISIHADAFLEPSVRGAGVFALSEHGASSAAANWLANNENFSDRIGGVYASNARGSLLQSTLLDMSTTMQIRDSLRLGNDLLSQIGSFQRLHKGTVERAGFAVLKSPDIPSVLVETAFISNPEEEWQLRNADYQEAMASAIRRGVERYFAGSSLRGRLA